ncbi:CbrC family protein [soil metagenome]
MPGDALPTFRYHPDPVATGAFERQNGTCRACGRARGWVYVVTPYAEENLRDALCPWCVADGSAAAAFAATFADLGDDVPDTVAAAVRDEIAHRTPGFSAWQQERWLFHCDDGAAFLGAAGWEELVDLPDAVAMLRAQAEGWGFVGAEADAFVGSLDVDGASTAYLFRCRHCGTHLAYADLD